MLISECGRTVLLAVCLMPWGLSIRAKEQATDEHSSTASMPSLFGRRFNLGQDGASSFDDGLRCVVWDHVIAIRHKNLVAMGKSMSEFALELNHGPLFFNIWSLSRGEDNKGHISDATRSSHRGNTLEPRALFVYFGGDGPGVSLKRREKSPLLLRESCRMRTRRRTSEAQDTGLSDTFNKR